MRTVLGTAVTGIEFVAGVRFLAGLFDSDETVRSVWKTLSGTFDGTRSALLSPGINPSSGPPEVLLLVLGFLGFGYILFTVVPEMVARMEKGKGFFFED